MNMNVFTPRSFRRSTGPAPTKPGLLSGNELALFEATYLSTDQRLSTAARDAGYEILSALEAPNDCFPLIALSLCYQSVQAAIDGHMSASQAEQYILSKAATCLKHGAPSRLHDHSRLQVLIEHAERREYPRAAPSLLA